MLSFTLKAKKYDVVGFYPYTSHILMPILTSEDHDINPEVKRMIIQFFDDVMDMAHEKGCERDNKTVIELRVKPDAYNYVIKTSNIFVGYYDGKYSIGFGVFQPDAYTKEYNKQFEGGTDNE